MNRRRVVVALVAAAVAGSVGALGAVRQPVRATVQEAVVVEQGKPVSRTYAPLVGVDPSNRGVVDLTPSGCDNVPVCDHIPLQVIVPAGLAEEDEVAVLIEVSWDDASGTNDLDAFVFDNQQLKGAEYSQMTKAATGENPEKLRLIHAVLGDYNVVVRNMNGANTGYKVTAMLTTEKFQSPVELLAPVPTTTTTAAPDQTPTEVLEPTTATTALAPVVVESDDDFNFGESNFEEQLQTEVPDFGGEPIALPSRPAGKVSSLSVILTFVVAPLLLGGVIAALFWRRRRATI